MNLKRAFFPSLLVASLLFGTTSAAAQKLGPARLDDKLVPREVFFGNPERTAPQISPDGKHIAYLAPKDGVMNVWLAKNGDLAKATAITDDKVRGIRSFTWAYDGTHLLYVQDKGGDENWRVYAVDVNKKTTRDLTPFDKVAARIAGLSPAKPGHIVVALNDRVPELHDLHVIELASGKRTLLEKNEAGFAEYTLDATYVVRLAHLSTPDGGLEVKSKDAAGGWKTWKKVASEDLMTTNVIGYDVSGKTLYVVDSAGRDTAALFSVDERGQQTLLAEHKKADIANVLQHPKTLVVEAAGYNYDKTGWIALDKAIESELAAITAQVGAGELDVSTRSLDDSKWIVSVVLDDGPVKFWTWDRKGKKATFLFSNRPALEKVSLAKMHPREIKARDGLTLMSYLTLPRDSDVDGDGKPAAPVPLVLLVHGGPWARDTWGLSGMHQWLASRGVAVLSVNFRGSTGFGKKFTNAGDKQWGVKMHDDLVDAVKWATDAKVADPKKVAIMGGSYGGYATLVGLTFTPDAFACGVDIVGPSNLLTLLESIPPYWKPMLDMFAQRVGDPRTPEGKKLLTDRSPLTKVAAIKRPLLIGQGANDPRVKQAESDQIVKAMQDKKIPVSYVLFPDEGHGFARPENRLAFYAVAEVFLSQCLGTKAEPIGDDFKNSSVQVPAGADIVEGVAPALPKAAPAPPKAK
jgi:dipeptidyl aminopeptidase/acylaminoacyl peptidase